MRSYLQWEYYMVVSQHQRSLHQCVQRNTFDWFWWFIASTWVMPWMYYTLLMMCDWTQLVKVITSVLYGCHLSFEFMCEILINKFEVHNFHVHLWDLIKHLAIPLCINISIWNYKFCCGIPRFCKVIKQHFPLTPRYQTQSLHSNSSPRSVVQRNIPTWCWNILVGWNVNFTVSKLAKFNSLKV
jgi:hypothetical protein